MNTCRFPICQANRNRVIASNGLLVYIALALGALSIYAAEPKTPAATANQFLFTSQGKTAITSSAGGTTRYFDFKIPNQATWQPGPIFADGRRITFLSMEPRRDGPGKPFDEYYTQTPTHIWIHNLQTGALDEICTKERLAPFETPALLVGDDRILIQVINDKVGRIVSMNLDGTDPRDFTRAGEGLPYGLSLSPDGKRVAYHVATPEGYQIWCSDARGENRTRVAADPAHLYFGTMWSPDGEWILYVDCHHQSDPGHDWADVCIGRPAPDLPAGSEHRVLTKDRPMWFAAAYGNEKTHGGGSNVAAWTPDGKIIFPRRTPEIVLPWQYRTGIPDQDHFNRQYKPDDARGGTTICRLDIKDGSLTDLTDPKNNQWDFRATPSPDGQQIAFCRAQTGDVPSIWVMNADGTNPREITRGKDEAGADHPRWLPRAASK